jgi:hypothetical protein
MKDERTYYSCARSPSWISGLFIGKTNTDQANGVESHSPSHETVPSSVYLGSPVPTNSLRASKECR